MYLLGPPTPNRRMLALSYAELTNRPLELVTLSADTTEGDLKQRREIQVSPSTGRTGVIFSDQPPVRAALEGGILVLDGIERAERNVLPLLNNLLENREINLESGALIVSHERYKELKREYADRSNIVPAHEDFRVVGLGLPVGPWKGEKLDPPLRSR